MPTLIVQIPADIRALEPPHGYTFRPVMPSDRANLGRLYFESFDPGVACATLSEAIADIEAAFDGAYGELWREASLVALTPEEELVAAIMVVRRPPWDDTPDGPFVSDLFTSRAHRRRGLARVLVQEAMAVVVGAKEEHLALRVDPNNTPALNLYAELGFGEYRSSTAST